MENGEKIKISIHKHTLFNSGRKNKTWYCDATKEAPDNLCLSGHKVNEYKNRNEICYDCTDLFCNYTFCEKCVEHYSDSE